MTKREDICKGRHHPRIQVLVMSNVQGDKVKKWSYDIGEGKDDVGRVNRHEGRARKENDESRV